MTRWLTLFHLIFRNATAICVPIDGDSSHETSLWTEGMKTSHTNKFLPTAINKKCRDVERVRVTPEVPLSAVCDCDCGAHS